jgi:hypothetical protein
LEGRRLLVCCLNGCCSWEWLPIQFMLYLSGSEFNLQGSVQC